MGKSKCAKSPISYLTTAPPEFETFKLLLMAVALPYSTTSLGSTFPIYVGIRKQFEYSQLPTKPDKNLQATVQVTMQCSMITTIKTIIQAYARGHGFFKILLFKSEVDFINKLCIF